MKLRPSTHSTAKRGLVVAVSRMRKKLREAGPTNPALETQRANGLALREL
jgi:hypothetical protein